jgi:hypothetical protein
LPFFGLQFGTHGQNLAKQAFMAVNVGQKIKPGLANRALFKDSKGLAERQWALEIGPFRPKVLQHSTIA